MGSLWSSGADMPKFDRLEGDKKCDVLVIGGGMAGLLCAYMLHGAGADCLLLEADRICSGVTKNTTAKISAQHGFIYDKLISRFGIERARLYLQSNEAAVQRYRELCADINCGFENKDSFAYTLKDPRLAEKELEALQKLGREAQFFEQLPLPLKTCGAIRFENQAQFDPLRFAAVIARGLNIHEQSRVLELCGNTARTEKGSVSADTIIVATHFPFINTHGSYFLKLYQHRSYVLALKNAPQVGGMYIDEDEKGLSFRNCGQLLLLGGGSHRTGKQGGGWAELERFRALHYRDCAVEYAWATQDCMSLDGVPYIGRYSALTPGLYVATGFNKWGMSGSMVAAMLLTDIIMGRDAPWSELYSPSRSILRPQLAVNGFEALSGLLAPGKKRCPHMGCKLNWNGAEHTWDCPCHGSRFEQNGRLIDNPATGDCK